MCRRLSRRSFLEAGSTALIAAVGLEIETNSAAADAPGSSSGSLQCGRLDVTIRSGASVCLTLRGRSNAALHETDEPLNLQLLTSDGSTTWHSSIYSSIIRSGQSLRCSGEIETPAGSIFHFDDVYGPQEGADAVVMSRTITVVTAAASDTGFLSRFGLHSSAPLPLHDYDVFIPGIWYVDNRNVPPHALAADLSDDYFIIREDRMPLPLVMMRSKHGGATITLSHLAPNGATCLADNGSGRIIDARIQVASLGISSRANPAVAFYYPATEGERSYMHGPGDTRESILGKRWVERFHPVRPGVDHVYRISIDLSEHAGFPQAMRHAWRQAFANVPRQLAKADLKAGYEASISLIADWSKTTNGAAGLPFRLRLPKGELMSPADINYQMGFVGQQIPLAYHLLRYGLVNGNEGISRKGEVMVDFWVANSATADGLPRTWYDTYPTPHWRRYNTFLRVASDGMAGALMAWGVMQKYGKPKPAWLKFCAEFGNWLIVHQNADGSWFREYDLDNKPVNRAKQNTSHPIRFLIGLGKATNERKYVDAALCAADWCYPNIHQSFAYVGGTVDNPDVIDKEAGFLAMDAFLALHDATGEQRWLDAAAQAGDFTETWVYSWNVPIPTDDPAVNYPKSATTTGFSLIATGHSGADLFMAGAPFLYYRLYLKTGDSHYADMASQLLYDTKQSLDINGSLGYGHSGLCTEALSLAPPRGHGVNTWLCWLTYCMIELLVRLQEAYGSMDTCIVSSADLEKLRAKDAEYGRTQGLALDRP